MFFIWGTRLAGKVDEVPGVCWVATRVFHLFFVPVIPLGTRIVLAGAVESGAPGAFSNNPLFTYASWTGSRYRTLRTGFSFKSYFLAYLVPGLWLTVYGFAPAPLFGIFFGLECNRETGGVLACIGGGLLASIAMALPAVLSWFLVRRLQTRKGWRFATPSREAELRAAMAALSGPGRKES